jgi:hypothetical protein
MVKGYRLDAKSITALAKVLKFGRAAPVAPPIVPAGPKIRFGGGGQVVAVHVGDSTGDGWYEGTLDTGRATAATITDGYITGMSEGDDCLIFNGPEISWTASPINPPGPTIGLKVGVDAESGKPIVLVNSFNPGPCDTVSGGGGG